MDRQQGNIPRPSRKETRELFKQARDRQWTITGGGSHHYIMKCPNACLCVHVVSASPSTSFSIVRMRTHLNRHTCWNGETPR